MLEKLITCYGLHTGVEIIISKMIALFKSCLRTKYSEQKVDSYISNI